MAVAKDSKTKKWYYVLELGRDVNGKRIQKKKRGFKTKKEAELALAEAEIELSRGSYVEPSKLTLHHYMELWFKERRLRVRESTFENNLYCFNRYIRPLIGAWRLVDLNPMILQKFTHDLIEKQGLSPASVQKVIHLVNSALKKAVKIKVLRENPMENVDKPKLNQFRSKVWGVKQINEFLNQAKPSKYYIGFLLALSTGMRKGEILGLQWEDIDFEKGIISVKRTLSNKKFEEPKTKSGKRSIHIPKSIVNELLAYRAKYEIEKSKHGPEWNRSNTVLCSLYGNPIDSASFRKGFRRIVTIIGLPMIRIHDLRHSHATVLICQNVHPKLISERLGHSRIGITMDTYGHVLPSMQKEVADVLDTVLEVED
jgi:integrase